MGRRVGKVAPLIGAWIEIIDWLSFTVLDNVAPLIGAWIEIKNKPIAIRKTSVAPLIGAWIEICKIKLHFLLGRSLLL